DDQIATFAAGANTVHLAFHADVTVGVDPSFDTDAAVAVRDGTRVRTGRNGEDAAGPDLALDGWGGSRIALPAGGGGGPPGATPLCGLGGRGGAAGLPSSPRGLARLPDGRLVAQVSETDQPLRVFDAAGNFVASWPIAYAAGQYHWDVTDGIEAIDSDHLVRT